ncbi:hypothetical protein WJX72_011977 [[Myrmecia] bisecta]|uniref:serine O-acetyltransferase n=1 Tax=[Myrmecia] bisecta TaxID=41462 RepID=A0AAW1PPF8_9CHLO
MQASHWVVRGSSPASCSYACPQAGGREGRFTPSPTGTRRGPEVAQAVATTGPAAITSISLQRQLPDLPKAATIDTPPSLGWQPLERHHTRDVLWAKIREEAEQDANAEPALASFLHTTILVHPSFAKSMSCLLANKLASQTLLGTQLMRLILDAYEDDPDILEDAVADVQAVFDRDPACEQYTQCILYFKGFQAVQSQRIAHWLWKKGRKALAVALQSRVSDVFHVDAHPAARLGRGIMIDHATGVVIGETAVVGDNVSLLHHVTLGGSGTGKGVRHPTIGHGVLLGAGVTVLGPVTVGAGSKVGAGSVVVTDLPCHCVAVGVPARVIKQECRREPSMDMDQCKDLLLDYQI